MPTTYADRQALAFELPDPEPLDLIEAHVGQQILSRMSLDEVNEALLELRMRLADRLIAHGGTRSVYCDEGDSIGVYKVPLWVAPGSPREDRDEMLVDSLMANRLEVAYYEHDEFHGLQVAPCRLVWDASGIPITIMEYVSGQAWARTSVPFPDRAQQVDGGQMGWSLMLKAWAAYDAGIPPRDTDAYIQHDNFEAAVHSEYERLVGPRLVAAS